MTNKYVRQRKCIQDILRERTEQDKKWGEQDHDSFIWVSVLTEEVGEIAQAVLQRSFGGPQADNLRHEIVQAAAVALAMLECGERNGWWPNA